MWAQNVWLETRGSVQTDAAGVTCQAWSVKLITWFGCWLTAGCLLVDWLDGWLAAGRLAAIGWLAG